MKSNVIMDSNIATLIQQVSDKKRELEAVREAVIAGDDSRLSEYAATAKDEIELSSELADWKFRLETGVDCGSDLEGLDHDNLVRLSNVIKRTETRAQNELVRIEIERAELRARLAHLDKSEQFVLNSIGTNRMVGERVEDVLSR